MLAIGYFSSLCAQSHLLITALNKELWAEDYAAETFYISNSKSNND